MRLEGFGVNDPGASIIKTLPNAILLDEVRDPENRLYKVDENGNYQLTLPTGDTTYKAVTLSPNGQIISVRDGLAIGGVPPPTGRSDEYLAIINQAVADNPNLLRTDGDGGTVINIGGGEQAQTGVGGATALVGGSPTGGGAVLGTKQPSQEVVSLFENVNIPGFAFVSRSGDSDGATDASGKFYSLINLSDGSVGVIGEDGITVELFEDDDAQTIREQASAANIRLQDPPTFVDKEAQQLTPAEQLSAAQQQIKSQSDSKSIAGGSSASSSSASQSTSSGGDTSGGDETPGGGTQGGGQLDGTAPGGSQPGGGESGVPVFVSTQPDIKEIGGPGTGVSGTSGTSGTKDTAETGTSGYSGKSGQDTGPGTGTSGYSGKSGQDTGPGTGTSGYSGKSGQDTGTGTSGYSGKSGQDTGTGTSGYSGSGKQGESGSGQSGYSGTSGYSGSGKSGYSGSGLSGYSGSGLSGYSGSGLSGYSGSGMSGYSGISGKIGTSGYSGARGPAGTSSSTQPGPLTGPEIARLQGKMLESKLSQEKQIDPLAAVKQRIEEMNAIEPSLAAVMAQRLGLPQPEPQEPAYTYGQETSIDDILNLGGRNYADGGYVEPLRATGGAMNPQFMYRSGGVLPGGREDFKGGKHVAGDGDGQSDDIPAWLADGEFVFPADVVSALGNGSTKAGTDKLYQMMHEIRARARSTKVKDLPPPAHKSPLDYLRKGK